ncbi:PAS domain S-box protein [Halonotius terrestris]|uniref:histidine kinase n=1 Tax=Halonotius terrestris TaxID=2487750 RepID=A0A8J8PEI5_9EURY|nr:ATP-binding protein [Halonotius terrestris]TQQ83237.1 PAS domain S-box protein [Halonotius terrestris]
MDDLSAAQYKSLIRQGSDVVSIVAEDGTVRYQSPNSPHIKGWERDELVGENILDYIHPDDRIHVAEEFYALVDADGHIEKQIEFRFETKNSGWIWLEVTGTAPGPEIPIDGYITTSRDISDRKEREQELRATKRELEQSNEKLEQFAYVASHDLQEPLRMIGSYIELLEADLDGELDDDTQEYMAFAAKGADRMQAMIDGLLQYSRVQTDGNPFETVDTDAVLDDMLQDLKLKIAESGVEIDRETLPTVTADRAQLGQVFQNLVKNAIEHGDENTVVEIRATERDGETEFTVADNGPGIPADRQDDIFDVFDKGGDSDGTGIGLAVCQQVIERHGGDIWVESTVGDGTTFHFTIPDKE